MLSVYGKVVKRDEGLRKRIMIARRKLGQQEREKYIDEGGSFEKHEIAAVYRKHKG